MTLRKVVGTIKSESCARDDLRACKLKGGCPVFFAGVSYFSAVFVRYCLEFVHLQGKLVTNAPFHMFALQFGLFFVTFRFQDLRESSVKAPL